MNESIILFRWNNSSNFLSFNINTLNIKVGTHISTIPFINLVSLKLSFKKKLAPLIIGAVLTSLALVNILIEGAGLTMIGFLSIGLLILYVGLTDFWVISIEQFSKSNALWISKNKCPVFPQTIINIIDFKIAKGFFPPVYAYVEKNKFNKVISNLESPEESWEPIKFYLLPPKQQKEHLLLTINLTKLNNKLECVVNQSYFALSSQKINKDALINIEV